MTCSYYTSLYHSNLIFSKVASFSDIFLELITFVGMTDSTKHKGQRRQLLVQLKNKGIIDNRVLAAIEKVPRHFFMDLGLEDFAYVDKAYPIGADQTISQPYTVAFQTQLLKLEKGDHVLEIGTGSGYQTAVPVSYTHLTLPTILLV